MEVNRQTTKNGSRVAIADPVVEGAALAVVRD